MIMIVHCKYFFLYIFFQGLDKRHFKKPFSEQQRKETIAFLIHALSSECTYTPRDDYKEIMQLCLLVLGHPVKNYTFKCPGANHHARWMSKIIYSFKIFLFRKQFKLSQDELSHFRYLCLFASLIFVKAWIQCPLTSDSPRNDLCFFRLLQFYTVVNKTVSEIAVSKFENHLLYVGPELIVFSLFSNNVTPNEKRQILLNMNKKDNGGEIRCIRLMGASDLDKKTLPDLVGCQSLSTVKSLKLNLNFMNDLEPEKWCDSKDYKTAKSIVDDIKVVNDAAERALALITNYNETLTRKEDQKQLVIQVVGDNRKRIKNFKKQTLSTYKMR